MDCVPPNLSLSRRDYVLTAATFGVWALWKQDQHYKARMDYYKCVEEKYKKMKKERD
jgi:hypothetical protein